VRYPCKLLAFRSNSNFVTANLAVIKLSMWKIILIWLFGRSNNSLYFNLIFANNICQLPTVTFHFNVIFTTNMLINNIKSLIRRKFLIYEPFCIFINIHRIIDIVILFLYSLLNICMEYVYLEYLTFDLYFKVKLRSLWLF
jgi:hypothetical protein